MRSTVSAAALLLLAAFAKTTPGLRAQTSSGFEGPDAYMSIEQLRAGYANGDFTVGEVVDFYLEREQDLDGDYHAVIGVNPRVQQQAKALDSLLALGQTEGALFGVPVWLKDNIETADGQPTTAGARVLAEADAGRDSEVARRLREAGAVVLGKTNLSEWANFHSTFSSSGQSGVGGQTRNAVDTTRSPCGSSAGSAVAVALGYAPLAVGTETNGSIVCPAHANGIVGIKPTVGLLSRRGIIPISESQDTPGPMARSVADAAAGLNAMQGTDAGDDYTAAAAAYVDRDYTASLRGAGALRGKRLGLFTAPLGNHFRVDTLVRRTVRRLEAAGATVIEIDTLERAGLGSQSFDILLYEFKDGVNAYLRSLPADARPYDSLGAIVAAVDASPADMRYFDHELLRMANAKGPLTDSAYLAARENASRIEGAEGIDRVMDSLNLDALIAPTGGPAWKIDGINGDNFSLGSSTPAAVAGYPNITVPMGDVEGLPVGMSFFGKAWSEPALIEVASAWEDLRAKGE